MQLVPTINEQIVVNRIWGGGGGMDEFGEVGQWMNAKKSSQTIGKSQRMDEPRKFGNAWFRGN